MAYEWIFQEDEEIDKKKLGMDENFNMKKKEQDKRSFEKMDKETSSSDKDLLSADFSPYADVFTSYENSNGELPSSDLDDSETLFMKDDNGDDNFKKDGNNHILPYNLKKDNVLTEIDIDNESFNFKFQDFI